MDAYDILERFAIMTIDGKQADETALEYIRKTYPQTLKNGVYSEFLGKISKLPAGTENAPQNETTGQGERMTEQKEKADGADFETLRQYTAAGFTLYAQKPGKNAEGQSFRYWIDWRARIDRYTKSAEQATAAISTESELKAAIDNGVKLFAFLPSEKDYLCFDIDSGHENGIDGLQVFADYFRQKGIAYDFFNSGATYTETPSGGRHLYFKDWTDTTKYLTEPFDNVEVRARGNKKTLTAAGSVRGNTPYRLHGLLKDAPNLPNMLVKHITPAPRIQAETKRQPYAPRKQGGYALSKLIDFVLQDNAGRGRNDTAYSVGFRIGNQYDLESVIADCRGRAVFADFPESELRTAIKSGMKNSKY